MQFIEFIAMRPVIQFYLTIGGQLAQLLQWPCYVILRGSLLCRVEWRTSQGLVWKMARRVQQPALPPLSHPRLRVTSLSSFPTPSLQEEVGINSSLLLTNTSPSTSKTHSTLLDLFLFYQVCIVQANTQNEPFGFTCRGKRLRVAGLGLMGANGVER